MTTSLLFSAGMWVLTREFTRRSAAMSSLVGLGLTLSFFQVFRAVFFVPLPVGSRWKAPGIE